MSEMYFSYDPECKEFNFFDTEEEAKAEAEEILEYERDEAADGWSEMVEDICWGKIIGRVVEKSRKPGNDSRFDEIVDYELKIIK